ncbi:8-oxo-dGTP diphosphatase MutT [Methylophaga nitratireducenticrescens]|jgi:8-oxo-dGTP diphosphatase|uniref:8-oxo-dGTP diphosphatase n=1 Tax=Pseudidiomarina aestuarii TaxID=624146 RepID=A0A2T4CWR9_9GAMM|nr:MULTISPECIES: 8-oxo-dGTP diphosphatase MutT [unclassified Methylophaga]PTB82847.1 8-oxo-dGTP diphosphatase MutT [Methylophaga nitratireducenticrescens]PTB86014.1 8-oxo-dGTP diphosphatase MutT [Pseudidiomarina aestuarii]MAP26712.1 8-oxo-dGTP diphosphatase MutT [Methylophaga sp.]HAD30942.1 8-oxo-dGTP diphosphatase MutT [Methylophaga sp.]HBX60695.1 8-oxo-dGTP diphosphatase MutT [Methylophaga sp.]|tara:strand:- start:62 stop:463 length:402 start_codon:yes stop_codon:yes gene_type:complete
MKKRLQVAVAIIVNNDEQVLIARRHAHQHQGDLWEFPGGKREANETRLEAVQREIYEEVGLQVEQAEPLMQIVHDYPELQVELDVWLVTEFSGDATGKEGQPLVWCPLAELSVREFPAANMQIIERLTNLYLV